MKPVGLWIAGIWCLLRGLLGLYGAVRLFAFLPSHHAIWPHVLFAIIVEGLIWIVLGVGILRRSNVARLATVTWCAFAIVWSTYGFAVSASSRVVLYGLGVFINASIIWYLLGGTSGSTFKNSHQRFA
jgi:hypothetical protein